MKNEPIFWILFSNLIFVIVSATSVFLYGQTQAVPLEIDLTLPEIYSKTVKSVVEIEGPSVLNAGIIYDTEGHILTTEDSIDVQGDIFVTFSDGTRHNSEVIAVDPFSNLAVLYTPNVPKDKLIPLSFGNSSQLEAGEQVAALGSPFGISNVLTQGIIGKLGAIIPLDEDANTASFSIPDIIVSDVSINPGNSGGPLVNMRGEVVGMNAAVFSSTGEFAGISFAIPSNLIKKIATSLVTSGRYEHPWLGVSGIDVSPTIAGLMGLKDAKGFLVTDISPDSPADIAGMIEGQQVANVEGAEVEMGGDVIVGIDNEGIRNIEDILSYLERQKDVGDNVKITVLRDNQAKDLNAKLVQRPIQNNNTSVS